MTCGIINTGDVERGYIFPIFFALANKENICPELILVLAASLVRPYSTRCADTNNAQ